jgi:hypothetical protein
MPTNERLEDTAEWLTRLNDTYGFKGVVHEVASALDEGSNFSRANMRYRTTLASVMNSLEALYDETGQERLLDLSRDVRRLIQWSDSGSLPVQLDFFSDVPQVEGQGES